MFSDNVYLWLLSVTKVFMSQGLCDSCSGLRSQPDLC